jgi:hypothetical protein
VGECVCEWGGVCAGWGGCVWGGDAGVCVGDVVNGEHSSKTIPLSIRYT